MSDMITVTSSSSVSPMLRPSSRTFSARPVGSSRLSVSPCSSRSTIAWCSERSRFSAPASPVLASRESVRNSLSTFSAIAAGVVCCAAAIALIGRPSATCCSSCSSSAVSPPMPGDRVHERLDDRRVEHRSAGRDLAHRAGELVALGDAILQEVRVPGRAVGEERDRVLGVVVLREHDDAGAGVALAQLLGGVDALPLEGGRHADVGHEHLGRGGGGARDQLVVVAGGPDDLEVGLDREQRPHALADDDVVVGEEDGDPVGVGVRTHWVYSVTCEAVRQVARATVPGVLASRRNPAAIRPPSPQDFRCLL